MKLLHTAFVLLTATAIATSCKDKKEKSDAEIKQEIRSESITDDKATNNGTATKLDGAWIIKRAEGSMPEANIGTVYEFSGSKLSFGKDGFKNPGKTIITDTTFSFQANGNEYVFMYDYKFNGDTLVVELQKSNGQSFPMVRQ